MQTFTQILLIASTLASLVFITKKFARMILRSVTSSPRYAASPEEIAASYRAYVREARIQRKLNHVRKTRY